MDTRERDHASLDELEEHALNLFRRTISVRDAVGRYGVKMAPFHAVVVNPLVALQLALVRMQRSLMKF